MELETQSELGLELYDDEVKMSNKGSTSDAEFIGSWQKGLVIIGADDESDEITKAIKELDELWDKLSTQKRAHEDADAIGAHEDADAIGAYENDEPFMETFGGGDDEYVCGDAYLIYSLRRMEFAHFLSSDEKNITEFAHKYVPKGKFPSSAIIMYVDKSTAAQLLTQQMESLDKATQTFINNVRAKMIKNMSLVDGIIIPELPDQDYDATMLYNPSVLQHQVNKLINFYCSLKVPGIFDITVDPLPVAPLFTQIRDPPDVVDIDTLQKYFLAEFALVEYINSIFAYYCAASKKINQIIVALTDAVIGGN